MIRSFSYQRRKSLAGAVALWAMVACSAVSAQSVEPAPNQAVAAAAQPAAAARGATDTAAVADIIVTANRRAEPNQTVPIAITAFSSERLDQQQISTAQDLQATVPSLTIGPNGQASRDVASFSLRGQGATSQASPGVVVYFNEVPLPAPITLPQQGGPGNFVDLESLQVLAGPQGTLFGRNTTGGAVVLVPRKPTNDLSGSMQVRVGNYDARELEGIINIPVVSEKLLIRASGAFHDRDGFTRDLTFNKDLDDKHWYSGRLGITFRPTETFENYLLAYGAYSKINGTGQVPMGFNIAGLQGFGFCVEGPATATAVSCDYYRGLISDQKERGPRAIAPSVDQSQTTKTWGVENSSRLELNDELSVRNIISYQKFKSNYYYDADGTVVQMYDGSLPINPLPRDYIDLFSEELQLQGSYLDDHLTFTVGGFYYDQKPAGEQGFSQLAFCPAIATGFCAPTEGRIAVRTKSKALYGQGTLDLGAFAPSLENLRLTAGYRYTWDTISGSASSFTPNGDGTFICRTTGNSVAANPIDNCEFGATLHSKAPNWTLGVDYQMNRNVLLYAKVSRGYKSGGFNPYAVRTSTQTFQPEVVTTYEGGFKTDFRLAGVPARLNGSYYYSDYKDIQRATADANGAAVGVAYSAASARIQGVEAQATIRPFTGLELGGNFSYTDFEYKSYLVPTTGLPDCSGSVPAVVADFKCLPGQYIAPYIYSFYASAEIPLSQDDSTLNLFVSYSHTSSQHTEAVTLPELQPGELLAAYGVLNASLDWKNVYGSGLDAGVFVTNATNKLYRTSNTNVFNTVLAWSSVYGEPRMYGLKLRYHFGL